jgi:hypothetical protein
MWSTFTLDWLESERLLFTLDVEPKAEVVVHDGQPTWVEVEATPQLERTLAPWIDVTGEADIEFKHQSDDVNAVTFTPRAGVHLHILSRLLQPRTARRGAEREKVPKRRLAIGTLLRVERAESSWRLRDRLELVYPLNRPKTTIDGALYLAADGEMFMPVDHDWNGGLVNELRVRGGIGYRQSFAWRFEALYIWNAERNAASGVLAVQSHAVNVRVKREF